MKICRSLAVRNLIFLCSVVLAFAVSSHAQVLGNGISGGTAPGDARSVDSQEADMRALVDAQRQTSQDPKETAAYKEFYKANEPAKKIQLGTSFLHKYPKSYLDEPVEVGLLDAYYSNKDWKDVYAAADGALALKPNDVYVLTTVGWLIPHVYNPDDPDAAKLLTTAEQYSKYAIDVIPKMEKPSNTNDKQFEAMKDQYTHKAHSALGLVYFRRNYFDLSAKELQQAISGLPNPDETDLFVLGVDLDNLKRYAEAADAYDRCVQAGGPFVDHCKQSASDSRKLAAQSKQ
jgi:tetratricopeptide (TPR) repeat protein